MKHSLVALTILLTISISAFAGPEPIRSGGKEPVIATEQHRACCNWAGFYVGGSLGYAFEADADLSLDLQGAWESFGQAGDNVVLEPLGSRDLHDDGIIGGGFVGYNFQWDCFVVGLEASGEFVDLSDSFDSGIFPAPLSRDPIGVHQSFETNYRFTVAPRVGFAFNKILLYGTGGLAVGDIKFSQQVFEPAFGPPEAGSVDDTKAGWMVGAGLEYCISDHWSIRAEYKYTDLGCVDFDAKQPFLPAFHGNHEACVTYHSATAGLAFRF